MRAVDDPALLAVCRRAAQAVRDRLATVGDRGLVPGSLVQHHTDLAADAAAVEVLDAAGLGILSEESGTQGLDRPLVALLDPLDGSTNASRRLAWYAASICVVDGDGARVGLVMDLPSGRTWWAARGGGAFRDGPDQRLRPSTCTELSEAIVGLSGHPRHHYGWSQYRALGAAALDLCAVAEGVLDGYVDTHPQGGHGVWDYAAGSFICHEAGATVVDGDGRDLLVMDHAARRAPVAGATTALAHRLVAARQAP